LEGLPIFILRLATEVSGQADAKQWVVCARGSEHMTTLSFETIKITRMKQPTDPSFPPEFIPAVFSIQLTVLMPEKSHFIL
jgi:hypothetical protein